MRGRPAFVPLCPRSVQRPGKAGGRSAPPLGLDPIPPLGLSTTRFKARRVISISGSGSPPHHVLTPRVFFCSLLDSFPGGGCSVLNLKEKVGVERREALGRGDAWAGLCPAPGPAPSCGRRLSRPPTFCLTLWAVTLLVLQGAGRLGDTCSRAPPPGSQAEPRAASALGLRVSTLFFPIRENLSHLSHVVTEASLL